MSESVGCTWPEQDAVWAWMKRHEIALTKEQENDLKDSVTAYRISEMKARERAERELEEMKETYRFAIYWCDRCALHHHQEICPQCKLESITKERNELREALEGVMNSYENYALMDKHEIEMDEYDLWMKEKWDKARRALGE